MKIFLGIDFGTTQTIVTMIREGSKYEPEIVEIDGQRTVDTALRLDAEDNVLFFGQNALDRMHEAPEDTFYNFKTAIGSGKTFRSSCKDYTPETLTFLFLRHLRQKLEKKYFNVGNLTAEKDIYCTIGCPASWNEKQRSTLVDLAEKAGFPNVSCCDEPFGVIYYYHFRGELPLTKTRNILVYDFGGGTTDVAIEEISPDSVRAVAGRAALVAPKVLAAAGISNLGGKDFDERLRDHFIEEMGGTAATFGVKDSRILENYAKLLKEALSISIDNGVTFVEKVVPMLFSRRSSHKLALSKKEFERICGSFIERLEEPIYDALNTATFGVDQVDDVIIAGGSSRLYYVKSRVKALFPKSNIVTSANPVEVVAKGLALYGRSPVAEAKPGGVLQEKEKEGSAQSAETKVLLSKEDTKPERQKRPWGQKWLPVAAAVAVMAFGGIYFYSLQKNTETVSTGSTPVQATQTAKETVNPGVSVKETEQTLESSDEHYALGDKYYKEGDYPQAVEWYRKAAEQGHTSGQNSLGYMYQHGLGVTQDHKQAIEWYRKAADQGDASGQSSLGDMYWQGLGVSQDYKQAVEWYRKAAEQGHTSGQNNPGYMYRNLGYMYRYGLGVSQDYKQAIEWYRKAAEQGNAFAQNSLSDMYRQGTGVTLGVSVKETEQTLESSDEQYALGLKYYKERDYRQAMEW
ncbi:MAG: Hsp70 family protein, partial [Synergistaceae bacterium]|nr:Hsp70 family protein [Synergistaceae bacterium]